MWWSSLENRRKMETKHFALERSRSLWQDATKWTFIVPKLILESLSLWPEDDSYSARFFSRLLLLNIWIMLVSHTAYFIENITDIVKMAELLATVNITLQSFVRITTMMYYKNELKLLLSKIWTNFWPSSILNPEEEARLKQTTVRYFFGIMTFGIAATCTTLQFMYQPLVLGIRNLPLMQKLPFSFDESPLFEILYVWNCFICMSIQFSVLGFDFFFTMLVWNCAMQFKILRTVVSRSIRQDEQSSFYLLGEECTEAERVEREETSRFLQYIQYHNRLIEVCEEMEDMFKYILLIQLLDSALALCVCSFAAAAVPSLFAKMLTFSTMYLLQLFLYCAFGNELLHQSMTLAYAAFKCGWHCTGNDQVRTAIVMLMQKSQKGQCLTARGFAVLNYTSCGQVLRMAFSFYTVLDSLMKKRRQ